MTVYGKIKKFYNRRSSALIPPFLCSLPPAPRTRLPHVCAAAAAFLRRMRQNFQKKFCLPLLFMCRYATIFATGYLYENISLQTV